MWKLYTVSLLLLAGTLPTNPVHGQDIAPTGNFSRLLRQYRSANTETTRINTLLDLSNWYLTRAGDDRITLDSATLLATQAASLSHEHIYPDGHERARFLLAKAAFKAKDWSRLHRLAADCDDSTRIRLALTVMDAHNFLKDVFAADVDSSLTFFKSILSAPAPTRTPLEKTQLLLRLALYYRSRDDSIGNNTPTLNSVDWTRTTGPGNWTETLHHFLAAQLHSDPVALAALATLNHNSPPQGAPDPNATSQGTRTMAITLDPAGITTLQRLAALAIAYEANIHWYRSELTIAEKEYRLAIDVSRRCPAIDGWPYFSIIEFYLSNGNASQALFYGLEAVTRLQKTGNPELQYEPYWCLGQIHYELQKPLIARTYYDTVIAIMARKNQNPDAWLFRSVTQCYLKENNPRGALTWLQASVVHGDLAEPLYRQLADGCLADCYFELGDYTRAEPLYFECYNLGSHINRYNKALATFPLGNLYIRTKQYDKARTYLQPLVQPSNYYLVPLYLQRDVHHLLYMADSATGNYVAAMKHLRTQQSLNDSLFNITRNSQIQELTFRYETERKDRDLRLQQDHIQLLQNQAQLQVASLQHVRTLRNTLIGASIMLVLIIAVLYSRFRMKQRANRLLRMQQNAINITNRELQRLNRRQQRLLAEKEWLMNEVHHRVKTNLQIVTSLLNMQVAHLNDEFTLHAFGEIGSRIRTLSLIHQRLYREDGDMTTINMRDYIHELAGYLLETHDRPTIRIFQHIEPIELTITQSVPVGLILNEAITNALLFAFAKAASGGKARASGAPIIRYPDPRHSASNESTPRHPDPRHAAGDPVDVPIEGIIDITMTQDEKGLITLTIADNGVGLPTNFDPNRDSAMGLQLIKTLGQQLDGETVIENRQSASTAEGWHTGDDQGLRITLTFQREESEIKPL